MGHKPQAQDCEVVPCGQRADLSLFGLADNLAMCTHQAADRGVREQLRIVGLPAEQARDRDKRQLLGQPTGPFLEAAGDYDAVVRGQRRVAGDQVGLRLRMCTDLAGLREDAEAARDGNGLVPVSVNDLRGKKPGGAAPSGRHQ